MRAGSSLPCAIRWIPGRTRCSPQARGRCSRELRRPLPRLRTPRFTTRLPQRLRHLPLHLVAVSASRSIKVTRSRMWSNSPTRPQTQSDGHQSPDTHLVASLQAFLAQALMAQHKAERGGFYLCRCRVSVVLCVSSARRTTAADRHTHPVADERSYRDADHNTAPAIRTHSSLGAPASHGGQVAAYQHDRTFEANFCDGSRGCFRTGHHAYADSGAWQGSGRSVTADLGRTGAFSQLRPARRRGCERLRGRRTPGVPRRAD